MPVYFVASRQPLSSTTSKAIADGITDIHCETTGAPPEFVNVLFLYNHPLKNNYQISVSGNVRSGGNRNQELTDTLRNKLHSNIAANAGITSTAMNVELLGFPAYWGMEGGEILPEPGEEDEWLNRS